jgi:thimet oligopeptidase
MQTYRAFWFLTLLFVISAGIAFCAKSKESKKMIYKVNNPQDIVQLFSVSPEQITKNAQVYMHSAKELIKQIIAIEPHKRTFANTVKALDEVEGFSDLVIFAAVAEALKYTSPDEKIRNSAHEALLSVHGFAVDELSNNVALYKALQEYAQGNALNEQLSDEQKYYLDKTLADFKRNGLDLPEDKLAQIKTLKKELASLELDFETNVSKDGRTIAVDRQALAGLSDDFINQLKKTDKGTYILGVDYPTYTNVMENALDETTRKKLNNEYQNRGYPDNQEVLKHVIAKRDQLAKLLGFESFAALDLSDQMVKSVDRAQDFIYPLMNKAQLKEQKEIQEVLSDLPDNVQLTKEGKVKPWDFMFMKNYFKKKHYNVNEQDIAEYFPMEKTVKGLLGIYEQFLGLSFKEIPVSGFWHEDVTMIEVQDAITNELLGYLLLDLCPRPNKYTHACHMTIIPSTFVDGKPNTAVSVVIANFPKSSAAKPSLLKRADVSTFFHEFGHALHAFLGRTQTASLAGTQTKRDFVELPSQMLEEWLFDKEILQKLSSHYKTGQPLPDELIERILVLKNYSSGSFLARQLTLSLLALNLFKEGADKDPYQIYKDLNLKYNTHLAYDPNNHMYAAFGHLMGYGAKYYGYMWSKVFAFDLFDTIRKQGLLNQEMGRKYIRDVIGKGGSKDPNELLFDFLGRAPSQDAFLRDMGLEQKEKSNPAPIQHQAVPAV